MTTDEKGFFATRLLALRQWERQNIPLFSPQIALDILLYAAASEESGHPASARPSLYFWYHMGCARHEDS